jgi:hypothetical protein
MARSSTFLREQRNLACQQKDALTATGYESPLGQAKGFQAVVPYSSAKPKPIRLLATQEAFAAFLAEDAEKHPEKLVPFTADMLAHATKLLNGVELG